MRKSMALFFTILGMCPMLLHSQNFEGFYDSLQFSRQDSLRGSLNPFRTCYDVSFYDLKVSIHEDKQWIEGSNIIHFKANEAFSTLQVDLFTQMHIQGIRYKGRELDYERDSNAVFVHFKATVPENTKGQLKIRYEGKPKVAQNPPWDGGFVWKTDGRGNPWIAVACEGAGASLWWPNKDHLSAEPDSMAISCEVPDSLTCVCNGNLKQTSTPDTGRKQFDWFVANPINNYNVTINAAKYAHFRDWHVGPKSDSLPLDYYVLQHHRKKAKAHFKQVPEMMGCFEKFFGPYPFPEDGYALVETPYWGMEHQSAIAYGNDFTNNNYGFDYIIVHESGHEWWGNSVSVKDHAEMWVHEAFTTYAEALFVECKYDYETATKYLKSQRPRIENKHPVMAPLGINFTDWPDSDMYFKGSWMLHTLRNSIDNDTLWFDILKSMSTNFRHQVVTSQDIIAFINERMPRDYSNFFHQYLYKTQIPKLVYKLEKQTDHWILHYKWETQTPAYAMPVEVKVSGQKNRLEATKAWQEIKLEYKKKKAPEIKVNTDEFYVESKQAKN